MNPERRIKMPAIYKISVMDLEPGMVLAIFNEGLGIWDFKRVISAGIDGKFGLKTFLQSSHGIEKHNDFYLYGKIVQGKAKYVQKGESFTLSGILTPVLTFTGKKTDVGMECIDEAGNKYCIPEDYAVTFPERHNVKLEIKM